MLIIKNKFNTKDRGAKARSPLLHLLLLLIRHWPAGLLKTLPFKNVFYFESILNVVQSRRHGGLWWACWFCWFISADRLLIYKRGDLRLYLIKISPNISHLCEGRQAHPSHW